MGTAQGAVTDGVTGEVRDDTGPPSVWREGYPAADNGVGGERIPLFHDIAREGDVGDCIGDIVSLVLGGLGDKGHLIALVLGDDG